MKETFETRGVHIMLDVYGVDFDLLNDINWMRNRMEEAILSCGATIESVQEKKFSPQGLSILFLLSESHFSIHSYPEHGYASYDIYTCGSLDPTLAMAYMVQELSPEDYHIKKVIRGVGEFKEE